MQTQSMKITAAKAREFLAANLPFERGATGTNRPVNMRRVNEYARAMLIGDWLHTHQGIGFDEKGHLKDGQHRLLAIVQAAEEGAWEGETKIDPNPKIAITMQVTFGLKENTFDRLDVGLPRSSMQVLAMAGYVNQAQLSAAAKLLYLFDNHDYSSWKSVKVPNSKILTIVSESGIEEYLPACSKLKIIGMIPSAATVGYYVCERAYPNGPSEDFINDLLEGAGLEIDSPAHILRNYMIRSKTRDRVRREAAMHLALYIKSWNDYVNKVRRSIIAWRAGEDFPKPVER